MDLEETRNIESLMTLFRGSEKAHGSYIIQKSNDPLRPKVKGKATTLPIGPTLKNWTDHYRGEIGLGIIPINSQDMCYWGALDVDGELDANRNPLHNWRCLNKDGTVNHVLLQTEIQRLDLPLVCCYSKSKSAHCFLFVEEPIPAEAMRSILVEMASKLGVGGCEIFPKQDRLDASRGDFGNWLNMPYFGDTRHGVLLSEGKLIEQDISSFLTYAFSKRLSPDIYNSMTQSLQGGIDALEDVLEGAPPCLQHILSQGIPTGCRNIVLFNIAVYCRKRYGENFREAFTDLHNQYVEERLGLRELENICSSVEKKGYQYQCKDQTLKKYCNANVCRERECGIDFSSEIKNLKKATRILTDPYVYAVEVEMDAGLPATVYVETDELFSQEMFRKACSIQLHKTFIPVKDWNQTCVRLINTAIDQEPPFEMTAGGQLFKQLQTYLINRAQYQRAMLAEDEGVYHDLDTHKLYFKIEGFRSYMIRRGQMSQNVSKWKVSQQLSTIMLPTDEIDTVTGITKKRPLYIAEERIRVGRSRLSVRSISDTEIKLEEITNVVEDEDVV
jgi:hypothetical protein